MASERRCSVDCAALFVFSNKYSKGGEAGPHILAPGLWVISGLFQTASSVDVGITEEQGQYPEQHTDMLLTYICVGGGGPYGPETCVCSLRSFLRLAMFLESGFSWELPDSDPKAVQTCTGR